MMVTMMKIYFSRSLPSSSILSFPWGCKQVKKSYEIPSPILKEGAEVCKPRPPTPQLKSKDSCSLSTKCHPCPCGGGHLTSAEWLAALGRGVRDSGLRGQGASKTPAVRPAPRPAPSCPPRRRRAPPVPPPHAPGNAGNVRPGRGGRELRAPAGGPAERSAAPRERACRDCGGRRPLGRRPRPAARRPGPSEGAPPPCASLPPAAPPPPPPPPAPLPLARAPAPAPAPPGRPGPRRREVVKIHVGRPRASIRKVRRRRRAGPLGAGSLRAPVRRHISCRAPLTRGELQCVIGGSRGVHRPLRPGLSGAGERRGRPKGGFAFPEEPPGGNKCTASPARSSRRPGPLPQSLPAAALPAIAFLLSGSHSVPLWLPGVGCSRGKGLGKPQAEQSRGRCSPSPGGGVPGCLPGLRGERVKKKKKEKNPCHGK